MTLHLADLWESVADAIPDSPALMHGERVRSWSEFDDRAARLAAALVDAGVRPGTTVAIDLYNCSEYLEVFFAALKIRAAPANVNYRYLGPELRHLLSGADARVLVYHASLADRVELAMADIPAKPALIEVEDTANGSLQGALRYEELIRTYPPLARQERAGSDHFLSYTGGTTGLPKGVMYRVDLMSRTALMTRPTILGLPIEPEADPSTVARDLQTEGRLPVAIPASPLMHSTGLLYASLPTLLAGGSVLTLTSRSFDPHELLTAIERARATTVAIVGDAFAQPMLRAVQEHATAGSPYDTSSLRSICSAGVAWSAEIKEALLEHMPQVLLSDSCGSTEGAFYGNRIVRRGDRPSTANFVAFPGVRIVDEHRREQPAGEIGLISSPTPATGYYNDPKATARAYYVEDGIQYVIPGDLGRIEPDGTITLLGRGSSTINTGGEKVFPEEVEQVIKTLPGIDDCLVFGTPDARFGQRVTAIVQPAPQSPVRTADVVAFCRERLADYKTPRHVMLAAVPRFPNGKPDYTTAAQLATEAMPVADSS